MGGSGALSACRGLVRVKGSLIILTCHVPVRAGRPDPSHLLDRAFACRWGEWVGVGCGGGGGWGGGLVQFVLNTKMKALAKCSQALLVLVVLVLPCACCQQLPCPPLPCPHSSPPHPRQLAVTV